MSHRVFLRTRDAPRAAAGTRAQEFDEAASRGKTRQRVRPHVPGEDGRPGLISEPLCYEKEEKTASQSGLQQCKTAVVRHSENSERAQIGRNR